MNNRHSSNQIFLLELTMRESIEGVAELATEFAYRSSPGVFEIISIEAPSEESAPNPLQI